MALSRGRDETNAINLRPAIRDVIVAPHIIEPLHTVRTAEQKQLLVETHNGVVCSRRGTLAQWGPSLVGVGDQDFPLVDWVLELVQVKCDKIVEKEALDLPSEHI